MKALEKKYGKDSSKGVAKALKEELNEDGHSDVPSAIRKCKTMIEDGAFFFNSSDPGYLGVRKDGKWINPDRGCNLL